VFESGDDSIFATSRPSKFHSLIYRPTTVRKERKYVVDVTPIITLLNN